MRGEIGPEQRGHQQSSGVGGRAGEADANVRPVQPVAFEVTDDIGERGGGGGQSGKGAVADQGSLDRVVEVADDVGHSALR